MTILATLAEVGALYAARGGLRYGEGVTQLDHALQCATLAEAGGGSPSLVAAALLHDIGHLLMNESAAISAIDDRHENGGSRALAGLFGFDVRAPIALHVSAKRYLCLREPNYLDALSATSRRSLDVQGGVFYEEQARTFERQPGWRDAVALRRCDDSGKVAEPPQRVFADYLPLLASLMLKPANM